VLRPRADGGLLHHRGQVEVISSVERDGRPVFRDLRWGVYVTFAGDSDYVRRCFGVRPRHRSERRYSAMYKPYHLIGLELGISVASVGLRASRPARPTAGAATSWRPPSATCKLRRRDARRRRRLHRLRQADAGADSLARARCRSASRTACG
jgi:hypothetical protein